MTGAQHTIAIAGSHRNDPAELVIVRSDADGRISISLDKPNITLDAAGWHCLIQSLAFPPPVSASMYFPSPDCPRRRTAAASSIPAA